MTVTKILGAQSGIQYQGVRDKSEADPRDALVNALFTGQFKRGPFDKPVKVTQANIRAKLGFDPENLHYQAIEDLLKKGAPFVWVQRVDTELKWGPWQLGQAVSITGNMARYTGFKTDSKHAFDSFAEVDLTPTITASLFDSDMQQWQAVKDACNELTGITDWSVNTSQETIDYLVRQTALPTKKEYYISGIADYSSSAEIACKKYIGQQDSNSNQTHVYEGNTESFCWWTFYDFGNPKNRSVELANRTLANPEYDPNYEPYIVSIPFVDIAKKITSNASSSDQGISLFAETYIQEVAKGLSLEDLIEQFEQNKVKR